MHKSFLLMSLIFYLACVDESGKSEGARDSHNLGATEPPYSCQKYQGNWEIKTFKGTTTESELVCNGAPCDGGNWQGYLRLKCKDNRLSGTVIFGFSSLPSPGKEVSGPLNVFVKESGVTFIYSDQRQCKTEYDVHWIGDLLVGKFVTRECKFKASYETDDEFANGTTGGLVLVRN